MALAPVPCSSLWPTTRAPVHSHAIMQATRAKNETLIAETGALQDQGTYLAVTSLCVSVTSLKGRDRVHPSIIKVVDERNRLARRCLAQNLEHPPSKVLTSNY
jgi:hypothetical protein